ncbi:MAG TPA: helix-turn-helix transcriptional regulator [Ktedonobacteraceae bacterium]|jgi:DNA-binding XRE family transcriptional regulator|nr:helix-turn-helix transcriptional regulator [Ktedonobacteraceae bacterium]
MRKAIEQYSGNNLKLRREAALMTQAQLAQLVGVNLKTVGFWEQGVRFPSLTHVRKVREVLFQAMNELAKQEKASNN